MSAFLFLQRDHGKDVLGRYDGSRLVQLEEISDKGELQNIYIGKILDYNPVTRSYTIEYDKNRLGFLPKNLTSHNLNPSDEVIVQMIKIGEGDKLNKFTTRYELVSRYVTYQNNGEGLRISKRIPEDIAQKLKGEFEKYSGITLRTACKDADKEAIQKDLEGMERLNQRIIKQSKFLPIPRLLYEEEKNIIEMVGLQLTGIDWVIVNQKELYHQLVEIFGEEKIFLKEDFDYRYDESLTEDLLRLTSKVIELSNGGNIHIEKTEAMTVVDVNTGGLFKGESQEIFLTTNILSVKEALLQMELRNIKGIMIIDAITMDKDHRNIMDKEIKTITKGLRYIRYHGISNLGLLEFTRTSKNK